MIGYFPILLCVCFDYLNEKWPKKEKPTSLLNDIIQPWSVSSPYGLGCNQVLTGAVMLLPATLLIYSLLSFFQKTPRCNLFF